MTRALKWETAPQADQMRLAPAWCKDQLGEKSIGVFILLAEQMGNASEMW